MSVTHQLRATLNLPIFIVDAFSSEPFQGNPAAICLLNSDQEISDETKQKIAMEMNLPITCYLFKLDPKDGFETSDRFGLRWYTATMELNLCGHGTTATSKVIFECCGNKNTKISFETLKGVLHSWPNPSQQTIVLDFPIGKTEKVQGNQFNELIKAACCGLPCVDVRFSASTEKLLVRLEDTVTMSQFENLRPPISQFRQLVEEGTLGGVILTVKGSRETQCVQPNGGDKLYHFVSRFFAPWEGVDDDPVCGSAHTVLGPYWAEQLQQTELFARQCSERGGELWLKVRDDGRVEIGGKARVVLKGEIDVGPTPVQQ